MPSNKKVSLKSEKLFRNIWEALRRNPYYITDFEHFKENVNPTTLRTFYKKWGISPLDPCLTYDNIVERWRKGVKFGYKPKPFPLEIIHRKGQANFPIFVSYPTLKSREIDITINTKANRREILLAIEDLLDFINHFYRNIKLLQTQEKQKTRIREMSVDLWTVYDMYKKEGLSLLKITRKIFNVTGHPAYDARVDSLYKQVKRSYLKAQEMIKAVNPS